MIPDTVFSFIFGVLTCAFCFLIFRDTIIMHMLKNAQAIHIAPKGINDIKQIEQDINTKLHTYIQMLIQVREGLVLIYNTIKTLDGLDDMSEDIILQLKKVDKELEALEKQGLVERNEE